jgi:hypothetical protein
MLEKQLRVLRGQAEALNVEWKRKSESLKAGEILLKQVFNEINPHDDLYIYL